VSTPQVPTLASIEVTTRPAKTVYVTGEALDLTGLVVTGTYDDGSTKAETITAADVSGYNKDTLGEQTLTVTVNGKTTPFTAKGGGFLSLTKFGAGQNDIY
jgi:hypothetical protein